ncbi:hypothetical protein HYK36_004244 [Salmonella enterica]|nr:hypothetical protein [Salmonella enterica]
MVNERKAQARLHIENVVADYRNDETRTNFGWRVKPKYQISAELFGICMVLALVFLFGINMGILSYDNNRLVMILAFVPLSILIVAYSITIRFKYFKEKYWHNDTVSDDDILRLCDNSDLKPLIKDEIEHGYKLTYSSLLEELPDYLSRIEAYHAKIQKEELIRKIDQNG